MNQSEIFLNANTFSKSEMSNFLNSNSDALFFKTQNLKRCILFNSKSIALYFFESKI